MTTPKVKMTASSLTFNHFSSKSTYDLTTNAQTSYF